MPQISFPGEVLAMTGQAADRLLKLDNGDAALLYLHLLRHGAQTGLRWPEDRLEAAGLIVHPVLEGLGRMPQVQELYVRRLEAML